MGRQATALRAGVTGILALFSALFPLGGRAAGPFERPRPAYAVDGSIAASDDKGVSGTLYTTLGKPLKIYDRAERRSVDFELSEISRIDVSIEEEHEEQVWFWKESGSDEKIYTGKTYPWRKYLTTVAFLSGRKITGDLSGLVYLEKADGSKIRYTLYQRQKGKEGERPADLVYVVSIVVERAGVEGSVAEPAPAP